MNYRRELDRLLGRQSAYLDEAVLIRDEITSNERLGSYLETAKSIILVTAQELQSRIKFSIEDVVNNALSAVFGDAYEFVIRFEPKGGRTSASLILMSGGRELDPLRSNGGGLVDILTFALRVAIIIISRAPRVLVLDEPFKHVSADLRPAAYEMLGKLTKKTGIQIIACTHDPELTEVADRVITVSLDDRVSKVEY